MSGHDHSVPGMTPARPRGQRSRRRFWVAFALELAPLAPVPLVFIDAEMAAIGAAYWLALFVAGAGWFCLGDLLGGTVAVSARILTLPLVWLALYLLFAGFGCDGGLCDGKARVDAALSVSLIVLVSSAVPVLSAGLLALKHYPRGYGASEAILA